MTNQDIVFSPILIWRGSDRVSRGSAETRGPAETTRLPPTHRGSAETTAAPAETTALPPRRTNTCNAFLVETYEGTLADYTTCGTTAVLGLSSRTLRWAPTARPRVRDAPTATTAAPAETCTNTCNAFLVETYEGTLCRLHHATTAVLGLSSRTVRWAPTAGRRGVRDAPTATTAAPAETCTNTCNAFLVETYEGTLADYTTCDDGGPGAEFADCPLGTDCDDCGVRDAPTATTAAPAAAPTTTVAAVVPVDIAYGFSQVVACEGDAVDVIWQGYHNIKEVSSPDCSSSQIASISGDQSAGHNQEFTDLWAAPGQTR